MSAKRLHLAIAGLAFFAAANGFSHSVWIEPVDDKLVVRFAEPGRSFEKSPGHLDSLSAPAAFIVNSTNAAPVETPKNRDHFLLAGASPTNVVCTETIFTIRGGRKPHFYARWQPAGAGGAKPALTLDLVPAGKPGEVRAWFRGQPLPGIKATLRTPDEEEQEITADAEGILRFESKQRGQHLLTIAHYREPIAGFHYGRVYQQTSHNAALTWVN
ncbi:MAG: DUF4198 domain-containing protein [Verrucomicrobia subdivision 3 bacterium]|nr:DUF4198 domain-containing protein [Limisphaerales bacterium]